MPYYPPASSGGGGGGAIEHLADIGDVAVTPASQTLKFHAPNYWGSVPDVPNGIDGRVYYLSSQLQTGPGLSGIGIYTLSPSFSVVAEQSFSFNISGDGSPTALIAWQSTLVGASTSAGIWAINPYYSTDTWIKGVDTTRYVISQAYTAVQNDGASVLVTITGSGTSRTVTANGGTPFSTSKIVASADKTQASYIQLAGLWQIIGRTSDTVVTISTVSGFTNNSNQNFTTWTKLVDFTNGGVDHQIIGSTPSLYPSYTVQPSKTVTGSFGVVLFGVSSHARTITITTAGPSRYSSIVVPLYTVSGDLSGTLPSPTVIKSRGLSYAMSSGGTVDTYSNNNTPNLGQVLTATSGTQAVWQNCTAQAIKTSASPVNISTTAPTSGQALVASNATNASWGTPVVRLTQSTSLSPAVNTLCKQALAGANITVALPATHTAGDIIRVKMTTAAGGNTITIDPNASQTIDGQATYVMSTDYAAVQCESDGANWWTTG